MKNDIDFETAIVELEGIVKKLEAGNVSLNESISLFEKGINLSDACSKMLQEAKQRIEVIKNENYKENEYDNTIGESNEV